MTKKIVALSALYLTALNSIYATDLWHVYQQAAVHDASFAQAHAQWQSDKTALPQAASQILPTLSLTGQYIHASTDSYNVYVPAFTPHVHTQGWAWNYGLSLNEPLFNLQGWAAISAASDSVKQATATYLGAAQDLIQGTVSDYTQVLIDYDALQYAQASKRAFYRQYLTEQQKYKVGLEAKTGLYRAQASYDSAVAGTIAARTVLRNDLETLSIRTGYHYTSLNGIRYSIPLASPKPSQIQAWVRQALLHNYHYLSQRYLYAAMHQDIAVNALASAPVLSLTGGINAANAGPGNMAHSTTTAYGAALAFNFSARNIASTQQAYFDAQGQRAALNAARLNTIKTTRNDYLNVVTGIRKIHADRQSMLSAQKNLQSIRQAYRVGTSTLNEVLQSIQGYYKAKQLFFDDQYAYINAMIALKHDSGQLSFQDIKNVNTLLKQPITLEHITQSYPKRTHDITTVLTRSNNKQKKRKR